ncbi:response regulator [Acaryochloris sp. IP29b_bin.148]|uniref:response regulator n=1 Tax=Acaryochloris sp. IP29b_bin.148 TaxID=2969218 RepID=UPI0026297940|nr:response regulator [Acaryochloris sp. IP29b_bin.148]
MQQFKSKQLAYLIANFKSHKFSGALKVQVQPPQSTPMRERVIVFNQGWMTYAGEHIVSASELATTIGHQHKVQVMDTALRLAKKRIQNNSIQNYFELLVQLQLFQWADVAAFMKTRLLSTLEQLIPYSGTIIEDPELVFDLRYTNTQPGFRWCDLQPILTQRQQQWEALSPVIPSIDAVPRSLDHDSADPTVTQHLHKWVNGQHSIADIATASEQDPLELAQQYYQWAKSGWLTCKKSDPLASAVADSSHQQSSQKGNSGRPIVLSVDDSPVVQTMIKRAIQDRYQVELANNAVDALNLLNKKKVSLVLLDVTMPDIDGLELCRTIRSISKFHDLPVVMLTAKDGIYNKLKGQMAGSTHYLTKPITQDKLLDILNRYAPVTVQA